MDIWQIAFIAFISTSVGFGVGHITRRRDDADEITRLANENDELCASCKASGDIIEYYLGNHREVMARMGTYDAWLEDERFMQERGSVE